MPCSLTIACGDRGEGALHRAAGELLPPEQSTMVQPWVTGHESLYIQKIADDNMCGKFMMYSSPSACRSPANDGIALHRQRPRVEPGPELDGRVGVAESAAPAEREGVLEPRERIVVAITRRRQLPLVFRQELPQRRRVEQPRTPPSFGKRST
ncbi:MAG: hypothetical protein V8T86_10815 [Victivallis sp.]